MSSNSKKKKKKKKAISISIKRKIVSEDCPKCCHCCGDNNRSK